MSAKLSNEDRAVTTLRLEMHQAIRELAGPRSWTENRKRWFERAARLAGITPRMAKSLFHWERDNYSVLVIERVRRARIAHGRQQTADLAGRFESIAEALNARDSDFYSADVSALVDAARALRGLARSRTDRDGEGE